VVFAPFATSTLVPVFAETIRRKGDEEGWREVSQVLSVLGLLLAAVSLLAWLLAPAVVDIYTAAGLAHAARGTRALAVDFLRLFAPQVFFYGLIAMAGAVLSLKGRFVAVSVSGVFANLFSILVYAEVAYLSRHPSPEYLLRNDRLLFALGFGTTAALALQFLAIAPSLARSRLPLAISIDLRAEGLRRIAALGSWNLGTVLANQASLYAVLVLLARIGPGAISAYTYAYTLLQVPLGTVTYSTSATLAPELATSKAPEKDRLPALERALRLNLAICFPLLALALPLAAPASSLLLHQPPSAPGTVLTAQAIRSLFVGLPGLAVFYVLTRAMQAVKLAAPAFALYLLENAVLVGSAVALAPGLGVRGVCLAISISYLLASPIGLLYLRLRGWGVHLLSFAKSVGAHLLFAALGMLSTAAVYAAFVPLSFLARLAAVGLAATAGLATYGIAALLIGPYLADGRRP
jgi:putative peptidoglycan lipid II flippase